MRGIISPAIPASLTRMLMENSDGVAQTTAGAWVNFDCRHQRYNVSKTTAYHCHCDYAMSWSLSIYSE